MARQIEAMTGELTANIHWEADAYCVDDSEPLTGTVVEDSDGLLTIRERMGLFHRVERTENGGMIVRSMDSKDQRERDTHIKGRVTEVEV